MLVEKLLAKSQVIWGEKSTSLPDIAVAMGVVCGDVCRQTLNLSEGEAVNKDELKKELGNVVFSSIRWCHDLGYSPIECIELAKESQKRYVSARKDIRT
jgi:hypothetical protein